MTDIKTDAPLFPDQEVLRAKNLRPGRNVDLVVHLDLERDIIDTRSTTIHDISAKGMLILAQTSPPLGPSAKGKRVEVTFLGQYQDVPGGRWLRVGYVTTILGVLQDYQVGPGRKESVIVVAGPQALKEFTLRLHYRLEPPVDRDLILYMEPEHQEVPIVDISAGGVRFSHSSSWSFSVGYRLNFTIISEWGRLSLKGKVVASYAGGPDGKSSQNHTAVAFVDTELETKARLEQIITELTRHVLAKRSGVLDKT